MNQMYRTMIMNTLRGMSNEEYMDAEKEIKNIVIIERDRRGIND